MIKELTAIEMALERLDRSDKFNAGLYEKARDEFIDMRAETAQLREDLGLTESVVEQFSNEITTLSNKIRAARTALS